MIDKLEFDFHHCGISVPKLQEAIDWYETMLGFVLEKRVDIPAIDARVAMLKRGALRFELFEVAGARPLPEGRREPNIDLKTHGNKHVAFQAKDFDALLEELTNKGADIALVVKEEFGSAIFIRDCAGNLIEFVK